MRSLVCLTLVLLAHGARAQDAPADPRIAERDRLVEQAQALQAKGDLAGARKALSRVLALETEIFGAVHEETFGTHNWIAQVCEGLGEVEAARAHLEKAAAIRTRLSGTAHWKTTDARLALGHLEQRTTLTAKERTLLERAELTHRRLLERLRAGRFAEAIEAAKSALAIREEVLGAEHPDTAASLNILARLYHEMGEYAKALPLFERTLAIDERVLGPQHPFTATSLNNLARLYESMGEYAKALPVHHRTLAIREKVLGPEHPDTAVTLCGIAALYRAMGKYAKALPLQERALAIQTKVLGLNHRDTAGSMVNLAALHQSRGDYAKALPLNRRGLAILENIVGREHPDTVASLSNLAELYKSLGEYARAVPLHEHALAISEKTLGPEHPHTVVSLSLLGELYRLLGEYAKALPLQARALAIREKTLGPGHLHTAVSLNLLGGLYWSMGEYAKAQPLLERALAIRESVLGGEHPDTAATLNNLAVLYLSMGEYRKAVPRLERALAIDRKIHGPEHPHTARALGNLASIYKSMGEYAKALPLHERALAILQRVLDVEHPHTATALQNLAILHGESGHADLAQPLAVRALRARRSLLESLAVVQAERQQLRQFAAVMRALDLCLSTGAAGAAEDLYACVLGTTGLVFARQTFLRAQRSRPELAEVFVRYESVCRRLSKQLLATPAPEKAEARFAQIRELSAKQEELEAELGEKSEDFRAERSSRQLRPSALAAALPEDAALVDFLAYGQLLRREAGAKGATPGEARYVAFVVRPGPKVVRVDLGPAEKIDALVAAWRKAAAAGRIPKEGTALRDALWAPIEAQLGDAKTVLLSPDAALCALPFAALPGRKAESFLVDEYRFAVVPVPRLLPSLLARKTTVKPSLLLVGEVDYGAAPGAPARDLLVAARTAPRGGLRGAWKPLPATRAEVLAVRDSFEQRFPDGATKALRRQAATEEAFRAAAAQHRWLHVATHGFFAPEAVRSALAGASHDERVVGFHPGLLSGIVLAGANRPVGIDGDDGILTALEVASLDLSRTEMVVLSACETGLGKVAGGEGVLGLQRAFQVAGARSTVTSLWKVDDRATNALMTLFYEKLWGEGLPRAEALRQAQLALMRDKGLRGLALKDATDGKAPERLPPLFWAGFVLSGDWR
ncbi:MAG: tetratricopeptide repeat protein [Planctomycetota bacterium]